MSDDAPAQEPKLYPADTPIDAAAREPTVDCPAQHVRQRGASHDHRTHCGNNARERFAHAADKARAVPRRGPLHAQGKRYRSRRQNCHVRGELQKFVTRAAAEGPQ
jgi:hypothetical protein